MKNKALTLFLALLMCFSLCIPAWAALPSEDAVMTDEIYVESASAYRCELVYTECGSDEYARSHNETVELAEPFLLQTQWFSGDVYCVGAAFDRQGNIVVRSGGYVEDFKLPSA